jgi:hypothetical protein
MLFHAIAIQNQRYIAEQKLFLKLEEIKSGIIYFILIPDIGI